VSLRGCTVLAVEGTHAAGKTTLVHALAAAYGARGVHVGTVEEPARSSPYIDDIVIHRRGDFDLATEVDLFAAQLLAQTRGARNRELLIADKTIANVLGYARLVLSAPPGSHEAAVLSALEHFCRAWAPVYDAVFISNDQYPLPPSDPYRGRVTDLQTAAHHAVRAACQQTGQRLIDIPARLDLHARVAWIASRVDQEGLIPGDR
jgi:predicted ATPase